MSCTPQASFYPDCLARQDRHSNAHCNKSCTILCVMVIFIYGSKLNQHVAASHGKSADTTLSKLNTIEIVSYFVTAATSCCCCCSASDSQSSLCVVPLFALPYSEMATLQLCIVWGESPSSCQEPESCHLTCRRGMPMEAAELSGSSQHRCQASSTANTRPGYSSSGANPNRLTDCWEKLLQTASSCSAVCKSLILQSVSLLGLLQTSCTQAWHKLCPNQAHRRI